MARAGERKGVGSGGKGGMQADEVEGEAERCEVGAHRGGGEGRGVVEPRRWPIGRRNLTVYMNARLI